MKSLLLQHDVGVTSLQAVRTYTHALEEIDSGKLPDWAHTKPPEIGVSYWGLKKDATMRDLILAVQQPLSLPRVCGSACSACGTFQVY